ncbi:MAG: hypothetical protein OJF47_001148 [Nitrospira sp.]|nr:MAG: hypothetical protein OJF47_001148 [Nitrospira sp.]
MFRMSLHTVIHATSSCPQLVHTISLNARQVAKHRDRKPMRKGFESFLPNMFALTRL